MTTATNERESLRLATLTITTALSLILVTGASAQGGDCIDQCRNDASDCHFIANEMKAACMEEVGCDILRGEFRALCLSEERDEEVCGLLREDLRECAEPCREAMREDAELCRETARDCIEDVCGIEIEPRERPDWRFGGHRTLER